MPFTVNPTGTDPTRWAAQMQLSLYQFGAIPAMPDPSRWRAWAATVVNIPAIASVGAPRPEQFKRLDDWAHQFNLAIRDLGAAP